MNILIYPCSSGIGQELYNSLINYKNINLFGANMGINSAGNYLFENYIELKTSYKDNNHLIELNNIINKFNIHHIYPAYDDIILYLRENEKNINCNILTSSLDTVNICRSKLKTYNFLEPYIRVPKIYNNYDKLDFPIFIKPDIGSGAIGCIKINNQNEFNQNNLNPDDIICEYLPGDEFTIDCLSNNDNQLLFHNIRKRVIYKGGISILTEKINNMPDINKMAEIISNKLKMIGCWFFQCKYNKNIEITLLEVAPRVAGAMALTRYVGVNLPYLNILIHVSLRDTSKTPNNFGVLSEKKDINIINNNLDIQVYKIYNNYVKSNIKYERIFCDFDDTLIINKKVNGKLLGKLYDLKSQHQIILITRHKKNIYESLSEYCISEKLFDKIIHLNEIDNNKKKCEFMTQEDILIDDSFRERKDCHDIGIVALDINMIELL
jgi:predicted ATP-grasp superfamily ATP-dependent carboligase